MPSGRIGVFDSGIGGIGVWRHVVALVPHVPTTYVADQGHAPYGDRTPDEIRERARSVTRMLIADGAEVVVVACNTASAVALADLRTAFPDVPFVGMEPAVKPAAGATRSGVIGVLATEATLRAPGFRSLIARHAGAARVLTAAGRGWVEAVEAGRFVGPEVNALVEPCVAPLRAAGVDQVVLGCTHYPFLWDAIQAAVGAGATLVDPAPAVARQVASVWGARGGDSTATSDHRMWTTGSVASFRIALARLVPATVAGGQIGCVR